MKIGLGIGVTQPQNMPMASVGSPSYLFRDGAQGTWYDPSDINLTWRRNLLTYTEQFDNAAWSKVSSAVSVNQIAAPDGATTADFMVETATTAEHSISQSQALSWGAGSKVVGSVYAKSGGRRYIRLLFGGSTTGWNAYCVFDLIAASTGSPAANNAAIVSRSITDVGNGWYRCELVATPTVSSSSGAIIQLNTMLSMDANASNYTGDGTSGIYIWGAQLEQGSTATPYQRITDGIQDYLQYQAQPVLYQDAAGTAPVTGVEQPVGLMLDKSKGLVLGPELVANGGFDTDTAWTKGVGWTISGGLLNASSAATGTSAYQGLAGLKANTFYEVKCEVSNYSSGYFYFSFYSGAVSGWLSGNGAKKVVISTPSSVANQNFGVVSVSSAFTGSIDNISVRELPGNHAFNSSGNSANFPVLSARYNLLTKTDSLGPLNGWVTYAGAWTGTYTTAPDGSNTAMSIKNVSGSVNQYYYALNGVATATYRMSVWAKPNTGSSIDLFEYYTNNVQRVRFSLVGSGSIVLNVNGYNAGISKHPTVAGWYYCFVDIPITAGFREFDFVPSVADTEVFMWGADLRVANDALNLPAYQRVNTSTDYDTVGFKPYLSFNGTNQWLQTNSIDFTATDKMFVSAGARKLSDAAASIIAELSSTAASNAGSFYITGPESTGASGDFRFKSRGSLDHGPTTPGSILAPISSVLSGVGDIANDVEILRINGVQKTTNSSDQGTGNYGNYPLYIGARGGSSLWFNGRLYGMVIAGKQVPELSIQLTEKYLNDKTAAFDYRDVSDSSSFRWNSATASPDAS